MTPFKTERYLTHVGSFPLENTRENMVRCLKDIISIPVDYPNYIQLGDMHNPFLNPLAEMGLGLKREGDHFRLIGELKEPVEPIAAEPLKTLVQLARRREVKDTVKGIRACVTGPFTLSMKIWKERHDQGLFGETLLPDPSLVAQVAKVVARIAEFYQQYGATYVNMDEPILSIIVGRRLLFKEYSDDTIVEVLDQALSRVNCLKGIHVCGSLNPRLGGILTATSLNILDHEFKDSPENLKIYSKQDLERGNKKIAYGSASSKSLRIETVEEIDAALGRGFEAFGEENVLFIKPDCGFRGLSEGRGTIQGEAYRAAMSKLRNLRLAMDSYVKRG